VLALLILACQKKISFPPPPSFHHQVGEEVVGAEPSVGFITSLIPLAFTTKHLFQSTLQPFQHTCRKHFKNNEQIKAMEFKYKIMWLRKHLTH
jgi:hypothetical protein